MDEKDLESEVKFDNIEKKIAGTFRNIRIKDNILFKGPLKIKVTATDIAGEFATDIVEIEVDHSFLYVII